ncbi:kelch repeat and BTB domain-containing protein 8-like isoform X1 [Branchiostoma floridae]|uniref:Kelch repeat and BTB domain-containing protein 8-like isoform X1 n=1 Tax=Branchiostoma floridae TaxID=7739 RepID=A0A9J7MSY0_BRAFL|nr:kelch repeat and BTB domain-containing protein 8-like isoform X1 [Branchiostoma floridae]
MAAAHQELHVSAVRPRSYQDKSYLNGFLGTVGDLQKDGVLQDVVLEVEGRRFPCHRLVLSAASPYFRAMFTSDMAESRQKTVVLQGLDAKFFGEILNYIYSGTLHVSLDKVQPLYQAADLLQLDYVRDTCRSYMAMNVERSTCVDLFTFADVFSLDNVRKSCLKCIHRNFVEVAFSKEFYNLSVDHLIEIISHDDMGVKEVATVWEVVVRWVQHSREDRLHNLPSILPHIHFNLLTSDDRAAILDHPLVKGDPGSSEVIRNIMVQKGNRDLRQGLENPMEMALLFDTGGGKLLFMNPREGKYISCSYKPQDLPSVTDVTVTSDNNIYILTREGQSNDQLSIFKYNHARNVWKRAGMSSVSKWLKLENSFIFYNEHLVEVDGILFYLAANPLEGYELVQMRKYNRSLKQWQECSELEVDNAYDHSSALSCSSHIYFLTDKELHCYDPSQDRWSKRTPPITFGGVCTAAVMGTEIFCSDHNFTVVYDTESDCWQKLQDWPKTSYSYTDSRLFVLNNQLNIWLTCFSDSQEDYTHLIYEHDRFADTWTDLKATLPDSSRMPLGFECPVARMHLSHLGSHSEDT